MKIGELPFHERPVLELLNLHEHRDEPDANYAGYGWAKVPAVWLSDDSDSSTRVDDALVLALHSADDAEPIAGDIELEFELPGAAPVSVLASQFLAQWLPRLPSARAIVLALCNPHRAALQPTATTPMFYALGDVESWLETTDDAQRIHLVTDGEWRNLS